jgi:hypothetical protein
MRMPALIAVLALPALVSTASARTWSKEWAVGAHPKVSIETSDAHVYVHHGGGGHVQAHIEYTVNVWGLHTEIKDPRIEMDAAGDSVHVLAKARTNIAVFGGMTERFRVDITVPAECNVEVRSGDGGVDLEQVTGRIDLRTNDGHITVHGAHGDVKLWSGDGGIDADGLDGSLDAHTNDGHIHAGGRFDRLMLRTEDGRIEASILRGSQLAEAWEATSGDGGITLRIPRNLAAVLDAVSHDGRVHVDLPIANSHDDWDHHEVRGALNGGTQPLRVRTNDGSITLALSE